MRNYKCEYTEEMIKNKHKRIIIDLAGLAVAIAGITFCIGVMI